MTQWKLVPVEPTDEMMDAWNSTGPTWEASYEAMLAAAPQPPNEPIYQVWQQYEYPSHWLDVDKYDYDHEKCEDNKRLIYIHPPIPAVPDE